MTGPARRWVAAGGVLAAISLGLPWAPGAPGSTQPSRVLVVTALVLVVLALRRGRPVLLPAAAAVAAGGVVLGGLDSSPGRLALAVAVFCLLGAVRATRRTGAHPTVR